MKNKKSILIVGASSFVGNNLILELKKDFNVFGTFNKNSKSYTNKKNFYKVDLTLNNPFKFLKNKKFHYVVWCVQNNNLLKKNFENFFNINISGLMKLMNFLSIHKLDKFIFFSSGSVYYPSKNKVKENSKIELNNDYKLTKYFGESLCKIYSKIYNFKLIILRPFTVYGNGQKNKLIFNLIEKIKKNKKIYVDGQKGIKLSCINVNDVSSIVKYLIINFNKNYAVYNLSSPYYYSITEFCKIISNKLNKKVKIIKNKNKVYHYISGTNKLIKDFKFISFKEYIERNL